MPSVTPEYLAEATRLVEARISRLRDLTYLEVQALPETDSIDAIIAGTQASITMFRYQDAFQLEGKTLLVVLAATPGLSGMTSFHIERGLLFSPSGPVRLATDIELQNSGG